ncbi:hypothetical protein Tco_0339703 [Tanacetum coccineum]
MATPGPANIVARRVTDDLISFSGETVVPRYMRFFFVQKIVKSRHFMNWIRDEAETVRGCITQSTIVIAELQAIEDQDEVHDSLLVAKDANRGEESKLIALNDVIAEALDDIDTQEVGAELEVLVERGDAATPLEHMREIVARGSVLLGEFEKLLERSQVGVSLKDGYVTDMEEKE